MISEAFTHPLPMIASVSVAVPLVVQLLTQVSTHERDALLESCSLANRSGPCILPSEATATDTFRASVDVGEGTRVTLEVTDTDAARSLYASRELSFDRGDDREERARAIGLALGVLATTLSKDRMPVSEPSASSGASESPPQIAEVDPKPIETTPGGTDDEPWGLWPAVGGTVDPSWGAAAATGSLGVFGFPHPHWGVLVRGQGSWFGPGERSIPVTVISAAIGPAFRSASGLVFFGAAVTGGVHLTEARLTQINAEERKGSHVSAMVRTEGTIGLNLSPTLSLTLTPSVDFILSQTTVVVDGEDVGRTGTAHMSLLVGALFLLPSLRPESED